MNPITLSADDVRPLARLAGLAVPEETLAVIAERLAATLTQLAAVPDADLADVEPAFVLPLGKE